MQFQGVLFDLDGTLVDSNDLIFESFEYALDKVLHTSLPRERLICTFGRPLQQIMSELAGEQADELREAFVAYTLEKEDQITAFPGAKETLQQLKALGVRLALVTSRLYQGAKRDLDFVHLTEYFDVFVTPESASFHKPHPEPARKAVAQLQLEPYQTLMVGDSSHDLVCGASAGCKTAAVGYSLYQQEDLLHYQPDYLIQSLPELIEIVQA